MVTFNKQTKLINFIKGISVVIIYFLVSIYKISLLNFFNFDYESFSLLSKEIYNFSIEILLILMIVFVFYKEYSNAWQDLKKNHWNYFSTNFKFYILGVFLMITSNIIISILGGGLSGNETEIRKEFEIAPFFTYFSAVFLAPLLEEGVFRLSFRNMIENKYAFIFISGLVFGSLHLLAGFEPLLFPFYLIAYSCFGFIFSYMLVKTNNIFVSMGFHFMHNGILMSIQLVSFLLS